MLEIEGIKGDPGAIKIFAKNFSFKNRPVTLLCFWFTVTTGSIRFSITEKTGDMEKKKPPLSIQTEVNVLLVVLTIAALITRLWSLENPRAVVFDEIHFGQFAALYLKKIFFFDVHPPLGKLLYAGVGYLSGWDADFVFEKIGAEYPASVPIWHLRLLPALLGAALCPAVYQIIVELGYSHWSATLAGCLILFDNALVTQSRFILLDPILLFFSAMAILSLLKFRNVQDRVFSLWWWIWLTCTGIFMVFTVSVKYTGILTALIVALVLAIDFWKLIGNKTLAAKTLGHQLLAYLGLILVLPLVIYAAIFYIHLSILNSSGPHDDMMTSAFQATLIGGLSSITEGQPLEVAYGSQITLRHTHGQPCWLHSHDSLYPIRYPDGRGSSAQQQVTCYPFKDINNWWIVKNPTRPSLVVDNPPRAVKDGDIIQLIHGITGRSLNSHDVAAPVSPYCMEVTCYIDYNISYPAQNLWKVEVANKDSDGESWKSIQSQVRLIHVNTSQALMITGQQLPEWGFHQFEVATDRSLTQDSTIWNVEEHKYTRLPDQTEVEFLIDSEPSTAKLTFWEKFWELQWKMLTAMSEVTQEHRYSSEPIEWPLMARGIAYWMDYDTNAQIHFLGNPVIWWTATAAILIYVTFTVVVAIRWRRKCFDMEAEMWHQYIVSGVLLFGGWFLHYIPFFVLDRTLFLHHYLPALLFEIMLLCLVLELLCQHVIKCLQPGKFNGKVQDFEMSLPRGISTVEKKENNALVCTAVPSIQ
ncbi:protein O-mannosyl-transferase 1-like isoform X2 [Ptychodera flava]|uniref:protein O-mannosyl-transferase 1-like isoform X2 n=1 Tax=Ptychodera flava TaxID=63121 RepID=UPI00396A53A4